MSKEALLPCLVCGKTLLNEFPDDTDNQPREGTTFATYGHYGSTFWDSFNGEELVINVCDQCLTERKDRLGQHKRYRPVKCDKAGMVGQHWVDRPMVPYTGSPDQGDLSVEIEELGTNLPNVQWCKGVEEIKEWLLQEEPS